MHKEPCGMTVSRTKTKLSIDLLKVIFGANPSLYVSGSTLQKHVKNFDKKYPERTKALLEDTHVDDVP